MANMCCYKVIVKGKKNSCYAFYGSMPCMDDIRILEESGTNDRYTVLFEGNCKWAVDSYCEPWNGSFPVSLPKDPDEALKEANDQYWYHTVQERSKMFGVEVLCNSADIDDYCGSIYEHYINGEPIFDNCPEELDIDDDYVGPCEPSEKDRIKAYYNSCEGNEDKDFYIYYENSVIDTIMKKYNYIFQETESVSGVVKPGSIEVDCLNIKDIDPNYVGVSSLEKLTLTLINLLIAIGKAETGFEEEMINRKDEIIRAFSKISGASHETTNINANIGFFEDDLLDGYNFELTDGVYKATYRTCVGGW